MSSQNISGECIENPVVSVQAVQQLGPQAGAGDGNPTSEAKLKAEFDEGERHQLGFI